MFKALKISAISTNRSVKENKDVTGVMIHNHMI